MPLFRLYGWYEYWRVRIYISRLSTLLKHGPRLISIMLGRLRMTIDDCISEYEMLGEKVFGHSRWFHLRSPLFWPRDKYSHRVFQDVVRDVVSRRVPKPANFPGGRNFAFDENRCRVWGQELSKPHSTTDLIPGLSLLIKNKGLQALRSLTYSELTRIYTEVRIHETANSIGIPYKDMTFRSGRLPAQPLLLLPISSLWSSTGWSTCMALLVGPIIHAMRYTLMLRRWTTMQKIV